MPSAQTPADAVQGPITLDGPVASGKTTVGRRLATRLGWAFIDTGLMYRAVAYLALDRGLPLERDEPLVRALETAHLTVDGASVRIDGREVREALKSPVVAQAASRVAQLPLVRQALVKRQQEMATGGRVVMAGRDIGTVVLPDAPVKVFLQAPPEERARRRLGDLEAQGVRASLAEVLADLQDRDRRDEERDASPLRPAPDAHILQTQGLTIDDVVAEVLALARRPQPTSRREQAGQRDS